MTEAIAPGYLKIIQTPMDLSTILKKVKRNETTSIWCGVDVSWMFHCKVLRGLSCELTAWKLYDGVFWDVLTAAGIETLMSHAALPLWLRRG